MTMTSDRDGERAHPSSAGDRAGDAPATSSVADWQAHPRYGAVPLLRLSHGERACTRLVVVSAHPDDESLGAAGLMATAHRQGVPVYVVLLTAGEASHRPSQLMTRHALATTRLAEMENALARLAPEAPLVFLGAADGEVAAQEQAVAASLAGLVGDGSSTLLAAPWRHDGHPDHEAAGRAAAVAAQRSGARLLEYPVSLWPTRGPEDAPWEQMVRLDLDPDLVATKARALQSHVSQLSTLPERVLAHFRGPVEHYVETLAEVPVEGQAEDAGPA
ncbi:MAG: PIG-L family deacetylase [Nocardioides sp.]|nr:PIG-L family deacetylase [Nocardioides sp.]